MLNTVAPPYSRTAATNLTQGILDAIDGSQQQVFIKEIKELSDDVKFMLSSVEKMHSLLVEEDAYAKTLQSPGAEIWKVQEEVRFWARTVNRRLTILSRTTNNRSN